MRDLQDIVVGYDGSPEAAHAVRWATTQARLRNCRLHLVHCHLRPIPTQVLPAITDETKELDPSPETTLNEGLTLAKDMAPELEVHTSLIYGWPAIHLARISDAQKMLVVGSRGIGGFRGLLIGSVSLELAATANCPVAVIRMTDQRADGAVVVAVDASDSTAALADACEMAMVTGAPLKVIHVRPDPHGWTLSRAHDEQAPIDVLESAVARARDLARGASVDGELLTDKSTARAILNASQNARLIVMGTKGRGLIKGTIGSITHAVLHHANGPVLVSRRE